ncbi:ABC transporter substrate-binding protein [Nocardioides sp.]|uniref:ABC transporter substrate-binding protein n=1 Tax=Nocardioides sp. TaxID=35761 RepID=UPI00345DADEC
MPDLRVSILTNERYDCATCFAAQALEPGVITDAAYQFYAEQDKQATQSAAFLYLNLGGSPALARSFADAAESAGFGVKIYKGIESSEFNYAPFVQELKDEGITFVSFTGATQQAVRLADAMAQQGYKPDQFVVTQTQYGPELAAQGGANVDGALAPVPHPAFTGDNQQVALYTQWLQRVKPGASPTTFGLFAWSATRLFVEQAVALGGTLTRESLVESLRGVQKWTAGGLHSEMNVGGKQSFTCSTVVQLQRGEWRQISGDGYDCGKLVRTSVAR